LLALALLALAGPAAAQQGSPLPNLPFPFPLPIPGAEPPAKPGAKPAPGPATRPGFTLPFLAPPLADVPPDSEAKRQVLGRYGPPMTGRWASLVSEVGARISQVTRPVSPPSGFPVTLINSKEVNAFAIGTGDLFVTRQLLALTNNEEELIGIVGHEVGHAIGRHAQQSEVAQGGRNGSVGLLKLLSPELANVMGVSSALVVRAFQRAQEHQSDVAGTKILADLGMDPMGMHRAIRILEADSNLQAALLGRSVQQGAMDYWLRTHPVSTERMGLIAAASRLAPTPSVRNDATAYIKLLDGLVFDDAPEEGIVDGREFRHLGLNLAITAPPGGKLFNGKERVVLSGPTRIKGVMGGVSMEKGTEAAFVALWKAELDDVPPPTPTATTVNGRPALTGELTRKVQNGTVRVVLQLVPWNESLAMFMLAVDPDGAGKTALDGWLGSLRGLTPADQAAFRYRVVRAVQVAPGDTVASLAARMAYDDQPEARFRVLNGLGPDDRLTPGRWVKIIAWIREGLPARPTAQSGSKAIPAAPPPAPVGR
jgi:predicted Zn-dependent protease